MLKTRIGAPSLDRHGSAVIQHKALKFRSNQLKTSLSKKSWDICAVCIYFAFCRRRRRYPRVSRRCCSHRATVSGTAKVFPCWQPCIISVENGKLLLVVGLYIASSPMLLVGGLYFLFWHDSDIQSALSMSSCLDIRFFILSSASSAPIELSSSSKESNPVPARPAISDRRTSSAAARRSRCAAACSQCSLLQDLLPQSSINLMIVPPDARPSGLRCSDFPVVASKRAGFL